jgi:hypothetical protein
MRRRFAARSVSAMKSEDELLAELRNSLAAFAASRMKMQRVEVRDFPLVDVKFYDSTASRMYDHGWVHLGDFVPITGHESDGSLRCFIRAFVTREGPYAVACYHPRPHFWLKVLSRVLCGRMGKVIEAETEFSDDTWIITTTAPKARLFDPAPLLMREHHAEDVPLEALIERHKQRVRAYLDLNTGIRARKVSDIAGLERSQARQHDITAVYRKMVGGLTADEIRRFSIFGRTRSAALKERLDAIGNGC